MRGAFAGAVAAGPDERDDLPVEQEGGRQQGEDPALAVPILQRDGVALLPRVHRLAERHHGAAEFAVGRLDDEVGLGRHLGHLAAAARLGEDVGVVTHVDRP